jgi:hypothetical protein
MLVSLQSVQPVDRSAEIKTFLSAVGRIQTLGKTSQTVFEWYGSPGVGKSILIHMLKNECTKQGIKCAHVDLNPERDPLAITYGHDKPALIARLLERLAASTVSYSTEDDLVQQAINDYYHANASEKRLALNRVGRTFISYMDKRLQHEPIVLLFDETERVDHALMNWIEDWVIEPLSKRERCLIVLTGRRPQRWKFEVRRHLVSQELGPFDDTAVADLFEVNSRYPEQFSKLSGLSNEVRQMTGGHPLASILVLRYLEKSVEAGQDVEVEHFPTYKPNLLNDLVHGFVETYAFRDIDSVELVSACRVLALLRQFDVILLRAVLKNFVPSFANYRSLAFSNVLTELRKTQLVVWDNERKGYALDITLRRVLSEYTYQNQPELYADVNRTALEVYRDWIQRASDNLAVYVAEAVYHRACLNRVSEESVDLVQFLKELLAEYAQSDPEVRIRALNRVREELDNDAELDELIGGKEPLLKSIN